MADASAAYPVTFSVEYPDRQLDRLTTFLRPLVAIPILIILGLVTGPDADHGRHHDGKTHTDTEQDGGWFYEREHRGISRPSSSRSPIPTSALS